MDGGITDSARTTMLRAAVARVGRAELTAALELTAGPAFTMPTAVGNAVKALRKHRDPTGAVGTTPYRAALPYIAAAIADPCLSRTIELLGEHADDPTRDQLLSALDELGDEFPVTTVAVMLASVADADMPASDLCFGILDREARFGLTDWADAGRPAAPDPGPRLDTGPTPEQRQERRLKKQRDAEERRKKQEAARRAGEQVRRARKSERSTSGGGPARPSTAPTASGPGSAPSIVRRAHLTPLQEEEYDRGDPWATGVVFAWVPFDVVDPDRPEADGKVRPCVVVAGSPTHLLVRPGYSDGGVKSRDWKSVPMRHWRQSGFAQPTWIDVEVLAVARGPVGAPLGWLSPDDWNALW